MFKKIALTCIFIFLWMFPKQAFAHGDSASTAPDMHPLLVGLEFIVLVSIGYFVANRLSRIGDKRR
ncbi:hypothetical protein [Effusibacillus consociatus]|uniref:Uncharacterized protein n=1 Tax=Effusibacillus consociatus TaxID=1117041 RepID=A0ABV9Q0Z3_9BACL